MIFLFVYYGNSYVATHMHINTFCIILIHAYIINNMRHKEAWVIKK